MKNTKTSLFIAISLFISFNFPTQEISKYWQSLFQSSQTITNFSDQAYCFSQNGNIYGEQIDKKIKPASVTKLYTTLWALDTLGKDHRFQTMFKVIGSDLYIIGGSDPYFVTENLLLAMSLLSAQGFTHFDNIYFNHDFFLNWSQSEQSISKKLFQVLNTNEWDNSIINTYKESKKYLAKTHFDHDLDISTFKVKNISRSNINPVTDTYSFILKSSPLSLHLKQVNMYSNNFYTDQLFLFLGGSTEFSDYIYKKLSVSDDEIYFYTGSGLGDNYTTCRTTLKMLEALKDLMNLDSLKPSDIISVAGVDAGTLDDRFTGSYANKVIAKTGTLNDTSALSGYLNSKDEVYFAVFNKTKPYSNKKEIRNIQDNFIKETIDQLQDVSQLNYHSSEYNSLTNTVIVQ